MSDTESTEPPQEEKPKSKSRIMVVQRRDVDQSWTLVEIVSKRPPLGWKNLFSKLGPAVNHIEKQIYNDNYVPLKADIFNAYHYTPLNIVKVIIIGQDPYYTVLNDKPQAMGLSFSCRKGTPIQPSLKNIFIELADTVEGFEAPDHGDLTEWAKQGVLLLNTSLTTIEGLANAHEQIWFGVIQKTLKEVVENRPNTVVMLWGGKADKVRPFIGNLKVLSCAHPSPMSAKHGFFGCDHFNQANEYLVSKGERPINWCRF